MVGCGGSLKVSLINFDLNRNIIERYIVVLCYRSAPHEELCNLYSLPDILALRFLWLEFHFASKDKPC
jgi:hypothetical protein